MILVITDRHLCGGSAEAGANILSTGLPTLAFFDMDAMSQDRPS